MLSYGGLISGPFLPFGAIWLFPTIYIMGGSAFFVYYVVVEKLVQPPLKPVLGLTYIPPELELYTVGLFAGILFYTLIIWFVRKIRGL